MTYSEALKQIKKEGGYANCWSLYARNRYASDELGMSLCLNPQYLYYQSVKKGIDLYKKLLEYDYKRTHGKIVYGFGVDLIAELT